MHLDSTPPSRGLQHDKRAVFTVHLTTLWNRITRSQAIPEDVDVDTLYVAIRDRLRDPEWEVRLHALRVLGELLPISKNALAFPFDEVVNNLGHNSPTVRKAALDTLKVFCLHCEEPDCAVRAIVDRCNYDNANKLLSASEVESNIIIGLILSIPSVITILRRRSEELDIYQIIQSLGFKLFNATYRDVALRSMIKLRRICGTSDFMETFSKLNLQIQDNFHVLCEVYDDDSLDVYYGPRRGHVRDVRQVYSEGSDDSNISSGQKLQRCDELPAFTKDISSDDSQRENNDEFAQHDVTGKVIIETEITFDSDTAITMTVLEENEIELDSDRNYGSDDYESSSSDKNMLKVFSETETEDTDVVISTQKRVRFGGEMVKIRTPDSDNLLASEDENKISTEMPVKSKNINEFKEIATIHEVVQPQQRKQRKSGIPLPIISKSEISVRKLDYDPKPTTTITKKKSKSLSELYDYFRMKNNTEPLNVQSSITVSVKDPNKSQLAFNYKELSKSQSGFTLNLRENTYREKIPSPVEPHREVEVLHNLQRSPTRSPRSQRARVQLDQDGFVLSVLRSSPDRSHEGLSLDPRGSVPELQSEYEWETLNAVPQHIVDQLHNTENWISAVRAADQLHRALLDPGTVQALQAEGSSLAEHMWALGASVAAARAPAESAVCALLRGASPAAARRMLPALLRRLVRAPPSAALPHALLARLTLPQLIDLIFDAATIGVETKAAQSAQLQGAWCVARAAGPAAVLTAVRRRLAGEPHCEYFCDQLRQLLRRPTDNLKPLPDLRTSQLPLPLPAGARRRRARSTPPPAPRLPPRRLRPLADSAPLVGPSHSARDLLQPLFPILLNDRDYSPFTSQEDDTRKKGSPPRLSESQIFIAPTTRYCATDETVPEKIVEETPHPKSRSPSIHVEDFSEQTAADDHILQEEPQENNYEPVSVQDVVDRHPGSSNSASNASLASERTPAKSPVSRISSPEAFSITPARIPSPGSVSRYSSPRSGSPARSLHAPLSAESKEKDKEVTTVTSPSGHDVRAALAACIAAPRPQEDWEAIVRSLRKVEDFALDTTARAPAATWRAVARATAAHVRSLRSRVARSACCALGSLYQARGKILEPETEEAAGALLDRAADVNRFLRADAEEALTRVACGVTAARAVTALVRRGAAHRAGPVRAAAACALAELAIRGGAARVLDIPPEPRALMLRTAVDLLGDASPDARAHARRLCLALAEDSRFRSLLKESLPASKYKAVEKSVDRLRCR